MTKGSYTVGDEPTSPARKDTSFKSFICALLVFLAICLIILLASINWGGSDSKPKKQDDAEVLEQIGMKSNKTSDKIIVSIEAPTTRFFEENEKTTKTARTTKRGMEETTTYKNRITTSGVLNKTRQTEATTKKDVEETTLFSKMNTTTESNREATTFLEILTKGGPIFEESTVFLTTETTKKDGEESSLSSESTTETLRETTKKDAEESLLSSESTTETLSEATTFLKEDLKQSTLFSTSEVDATTKTEVEKTTVLTTTQNDETGTTTIDNISATESTTEKGLEEPLTSSTMQDDQVENSTTFNKIAKTEANLLDRTRRSDLEETTFSTEATTETDMGETVPLITTTESILHLFDNATEKITKRNVEETTSQKYQTESMTVEIAETEETTRKSIEKTTQNVTILDLVLTTASAETTVEDQEISITEEETESLNNKTQTSPLRLRMVPTTSSVHFKNSQRVCGSATCKAAASRMLSLMNHSAEACEDFYELACGGMRHVQEKSIEESVTDMLSVQLNVLNNASAKYWRNFKEFYSSCLTHEDDFKYRQRMKGVEDLLRDVGEFRLATDSSPVDLTDLVAKLILRQSMPLFDIGLDVDKQTSNLILQLTLPERSSLRTGLEKWTGLSSQRDRCLKKQKSQIDGTYISLTKVYESYVMCQKDHADYLNSIESVIREMEIFSNLSSQEQLSEIKDIRFSIEFEVLNHLDSLPSLAEIINKFDNKKYDVRKISDLQVQYPVIQWNRLFEILTGHEVRDSTTVQVYFGDYFSTMFHSLRTVDKRKINNALLAIYANDLFINTVVPIKKTNREQYCLDLSRRLLPDVWAHFIQSTLSIKGQASQNQIITNLFTLLKKNLYKSLWQAEWIDEYSQISILSKCNDLNLVLFSPPDEATLIKNYQNVELTGNYQTNLIELLAHSRRIIYSTEGTPLSVKTIFSYFLDPLSSESLTFYPSNFIAVPPGLLRQVPDGLPGYLVMARVGFHLAQQIARHFDPTAMKYKIKLSSTSENTYSNLISTLSDAIGYSSPRTLENRNITFNIKGALSVNERMVDNTAFRLVLDSFNSYGVEELLPWISTSYSREKIFFVAVAQEFCKRTTILDFMLQVFEGSHLPAALRVENIMGNSAQFFDKFSCPEGSGMEVFFEKTQFPYLIPVDDYEYETMQTSK